MRLLSLMMTALAVILLVSGCTPEEYFLMNPAGDPVRIAALLPMSGGSRIYAEQMSEGAIFAAEEINGARGVNGHRVEIKVFDTCGTEAGTAKAADEAAQWGASGVIAGYGTEEVSRVIRYTATRRLPSVIPLATSNRHVSVSPYVYRNSYTDAQQMDVLAAYLYLWREVRELGIFTDTFFDAEYCSNISSDAAQSMRQFGGEVVKNIVVEDEVLPQAKLKEMLSASPTAILLAYSDSVRAATMVRRLREAGFRGVIAGPDSWDDFRFFDTLRGSDPGDCVFTGFINEESRSPESVNFRKNFRKRFYHQPGAVETQTYDAVKMLAIGLSDASTLQEFDKNWRTIQDYQGAAALYTMLPKGELDRTIYLNTIGVSRDSGIPVPYSRFSQKLQYSKLADYKDLE